MADEIDILFMAKIEKDQRKSIFCDDIFKCYKFLIF